MNSDCSAPGFPDFLATFIHFRNLATQCPSAYTGLVIELFFQDNRLDRRVKPRLHQQQRQSNIVECYKSNDSFDRVERCFDMVALLVWTGIKKHQKYQASRSQWMINHCAWQTQRVCSILVSGQRVITEAENSLPETSELEVGLVERISPV